MAEPTYDSSSIQVMKGLEAVRVRPGMYIGGTDQRGLLHLLWEAIDNAVDEHVAGHGRVIDVTLHKDGSATVADQGRGIPVDMHPSEKKSALEVVMTMLHAGGKFGQDGSAYEHSGGLHGVGISVVNALSSELKAVVHTGGYEWTQSYKRGIPTAKVKQGKKVGKKDTGTTIHFMPDTEIFETLGFGHDAVLRRLREVSFLEPGLAFLLTDEKSGGHETISHPNGIVDYVREINEGKDELVPSKPILFETDDPTSGTKVRIAWQYADQREEILTSFANNIPTIEHGNHVTGWRTGFTRALNYWARKEKVLKDKDSNLEGADVRDGQTTIVAVKMRNPQFDGQTKARLGNPEIESVVSAMVYERTLALLEKQPNIGKAIVRRALTARDARESAKAAADSVRKKRAITMPMKLADCSSKKPEERELYICEGNSAGGSAKSARNPKTQAVLAIKGKILNVEKATLANGLKNEEVISIIQSIGTGILGGMKKDDDGGFNIEALRYHKIIIMTDADVDGKHIQQLLLTLFFRYMRPLVEHGHVYIARPPLFRVDVGRNKYFALNEKELAVLQKQHPDGEVARFKGLGEMKGPELAATAMNPETRSIVQITIDNLGEADRMFTTLMGTPTEPKKAYLDTHQGEAYERGYDIS